MRFDLEVNQNNDLKYNDYYRLRNSYLQLMSMTVKIEVAAQCQRHTVDGTWPECTGFVDFEKKSNVRRKQNFET